jgi:hypothetical protein
MQASGAAPRQREAADGLKHLYRLCGLQRLARLDRLARLLRL